MIVFIIITAYIFNVFLNRYLNKILCKMDEYQTPIPFFWFLSMIATILFIIVIFTKLKMPNNWFTGKNWNN